MSHIIHFTAAVDAPTSEVAAELEQLLESCSLAVAEHFTHADPSRSPLMLKRSRVQLPGFDGRWFGTGRAEERLGELINVLATVARTVDVAGSGNANGKMSKDLATLLGSDANAELLLAVSESSGRWLTRADGGNAVRRGASCHVLAQVPADRDLPTWIVAVEPFAPSTDAGAGADSM